MRVIDLALKDLLQIVRDWKAALFMVVMPIIFTMFFGFAFGGSGGGACFARTGGGVFFCQRRRRLIRARRACSLASRASSSTSCADIFF